MSDVFTALLERKHEATFVSADFARGLFRFVVDGVPVLLRAGDARDNGPASIWFFASREGSNHFARVNAAKILAGVPYAFVDEEGRPTNPIPNPWPAAWELRYPDAPLASWDEMATRLGITARVQEVRDLIYLDAESLADAIEFVLQHDGEKRT